MKGISGVVVMAMLSGVLLPGIAGAQTREKGPWWPNAQWGAADAAGGSNWITPDKVLTATALVKTGRMIELGHVYERGMPLIGNRSYNIFIPSFPTHGPFGDKKWSSTTNTSPARSARWAHSSTAPGTSASR